MFLSPLIPLEIYTHAKKLGNTLNNFLIFFEKYHFFIVVVDKYARLYALRS